jgi:zinc protease
MNPPIRRRGRAFVTACAALSAGIASAAELPPAPAAPEDFVVPAAETIELPNGLAATFLPFGDVPKVTITAVVRAGILNEDGQPWLASLTASMLSEGTRTRSAADIAVAAAGMGGQLVVGSGDDETTAMLDVLSESGPQAIALIADVLLHPTLPASEFDRVRQDALRNLSVSRTQPQSLAAEAFRKALYGDHAYGQTFPTEAQLNGYSVADVERYYRENFGAQRTHVYVAGHYDRTAMEQAVRTAFADWARGPAPRIDVPEPVATRQVRLIERDGAPQSTIYLGLPVVPISHPDFMALSVLNTLLGGYFSSRITSNIREDKGYTYSPYSSFATRYRDTVWVEVADVTTADTGPALTEIYREIARLRREPPGAAELRGVQNYRNGVFLIANATRGGLVGQLAFMNLHELPDAWLTSFIDRLYAVTPEQVSEAARKYLDPGEMTLVVVGDLRVVRPQLARVEELRGLTFD